MLQKTIQLKQLAVILGIIISISTVIGILFQLDNRWAKVYALDEVKEEMHQIDYRLDYKILKDQAQDLRERMWHLENMHGPWHRNEKWPDHAVREYKQLQQDRNEMLDELKHMRRYQRKDTA